MRVHATRIRVGRIADGVAVTVVGGALLVGGATWVEGGASREAVAACLRLVNAMLVLGGALGAARARVRGEVAALAAMGGGPVAWGVAGACVGVLVGTIAGVSGVGWGPGGGWHWVASFDGVSGGWWFDGQPLPGSEVHPTRLLAGRAGLAGGFRGALACALGVHVGLHARSAGRTLALAAAGAMAVTLTG